MRTLSKLILLSFALCVVFINPAYCEGTGALTVWLLDQSNTEAFERLRKAYIEENKEVEITCHTISWEEASKIYRTRQSFMEGTQKYGTPDIIQVPSTWASHFIESLKILSAINVSGTKYKSGILPSFKDNEKYFLPWFFDIRVLYYRKEFLKEIGQNKSNLADWNGFIAACDKIKKKKIRLVTSINQNTGKQIYKLDNNGRKKVLPLGVTGMLDVGWNIIHNIIAPHYWARTNDQIKGPITTGNVRTQLKDDIDFYSDLVSRFVPIRDLDKDEEAIQREFVMGLYAMHFSGPHLTGKLKERWGEKWHEHFGVVNIPGINNLKTSFYGGSYLGVHRHSPRKSEAVKFIKYCCTNPKPQIQYSADVCMIPAGSWLQNGHTDEITSTFKFHNPYWKIFLDAPNLRTYPSDPAWFYVEQNLPSTLSWLKYGSRPYRIKILINTTFNNIVEIFLSLVIIGTILFLTLKIFRGKSKKEKVLDVTHEPEETTPPPHEASEEITKSPDNTFSEKRPDKKEWPDPKICTTASYNMDCNNSLHFSTKTSGKSDGKAIFPVNENKKASKQMSLMLLLCTNPKGVNFTEIVQAVYPEDKKSLEKLKEKLNSLINEGQPTEQAGVKKEMDLLIKRVCALIEATRKKLAKKGLNPEIIPQYSKADVLNNSCYANFI